MTAWRARSAPGREPRGTVGDRQSRPAARTASPPGMAAGAVGTRCGRRSLTGCSTAAMLAVGGDGARTCPVSRSIRQSRARMDLPGWWLGDEFEVDVEGAVGLGGPAVAGGEGDSVF